MPGLGRVDSVGSWRGLYSTWKLITSKRSARKSFRWIGIASASWLESTEALG